MATDESQVNPTDEEITAQVGPPPSDASDVTPDAAPTEPEERDVAPPEEERRPRKEKEEGAESEGDAAKPKLFKRIIQLVTWNPLPFFKSLPKKFFVWLKENKVRAAAIGLFIIVTILSAITLSLVIGDGTNTRSIAKAITALENGDLIKSKEIARSIAMQPRKTSRDLADSAFVLGMVAADNAKAGWPEDQSSYTRYTLAARYFDIAYPEGFPKKFELQGLKTYGDVLLHCHRYAKSQKVLEEALKVAETPKEKTEVRYLLVENDLNAENPDLTEIMRHNKAYLADKELTDEQRFNGILQKVQILTRQEKYKEAHKLLDSVPKTPAYSEKVYYAQGRLEMREAEAALKKGTSNAESIREKLEDEAIKSFRRAQGNAQDSSPTIPKSKYLIGVCLEQLGENRAAIRQWEEIVELYPDSPEAIGAEYRLGELYFYEEALQKVPTKAIEYFKKVGDALIRQGHSNPWVTSPELQANALNRIKAFRKEKKLESALGLARAIAPLLSDLESMRLLATLDRDLGIQILDSFDPGIVSKENREKESKARLHLREASLLYSAIAKRETVSKHLVDDLWQSAECALAGNDFTQAVKMYIAYLNFEPEKRNADALLGLGKAYLAIGKIDEAIDTFEQCIEFYPGELATFQSRLFAAEAWIEKGDPKPAERLLLENWSAAGITPQSLIWRESLYRLGALYHDTQQYDKAIQRLEDAVRRFPDDPRTNLARYLLADSYRLRA
ncbi:MAG: tetratricopeptide repeat protein, partial [Planctomycetia bacterium]